LQGFVIHRTSVKFWKNYHQLPVAIQKQADEQFEFLKKNSQHPSLHFKKVGAFWSVRIGIHYRALAVQEGDDLVWFWIGTHSEYDKLI
jgi:hypothetical protein